MSIAAGVSKSAWYNFQTNEYDYLDAPETDEDAIAYLPQYIAAQGLYLAKRAQGLNILNAMCYVLTACVGERGPKVVG